MCQVHREQLQYQAASLALSEGQDLKSERRCAVNIRPMAKAGIWTGRICNELCMST